MCNINLCVTYLVASTATAQFNDEMCQT